MEWWALLLLAFGTLIVLFLLGVPVPFAFLFILLIGGWVFWGGMKGLILIIFSMFESIKNYNLTTIIFFMVMGFLLFNSGMAQQLIDALDRWFGRLPGRLSLLGVAAGALIGALSGSGGASVALLGSLLVPEMERRGYKRAILIGPIMGAGGLAIIIPPSGLAVLLGTIAEIPIGPLLISGVVPGLLLASFYAIYIIGRCKLQPSLAPAYDAPRIKLSEKVAITARDVLPFGLIIFLVMGLILLGIASPNESAATGAFGCLVLSIAYRRLNWNVIKQSLIGTVRSSVMLLMIFTGSVGFSQLLAYSGATRGLIEFATSLPVSPSMLLIFMMLGIVVLGCFIDAVSIIMISVPIYMPIVNHFGFDLVWFGIMMLILIEMGGKTPPFGMSLFLMKGLAPQGTTMADVIRSVTPIVFIELLTVSLIMAFPAIAIWLPGLIRKI